MTATAFRVAAAVAVRREETAGGLLIGPTYTLTLEGMRYTGAFAVYAGREQLTEQPLTVECARTVATHLAGHGPWDGYHLTEAQRAAVNALATHPCLTGRCRCSGAQ